VNRRTFGLARGAHLHDRPSGDVVGVVRDNAEFHHITGPDDGWIMVGVSTQFGEVPVWARVAAP
jgi:hypothetical protein